MQITRREFCQSTAALALATALVGASSLSPGGAAETVPAAELMKPDALPEMIMGNDKAPVTVIEYASMTCPHCAHFQETTFPELKKRYIDTGKVRYIFREFPLDNLAAAAFMLARCAGKDDKDKYFALIDTLFQQQRQWAVEKPLPPLLAIAKQAGFTEEFFKSLPRESAGARWHRKRAQTRRRHFQSAVNAHLFHQWDVLPGRLVHRGHGQGDRPLSQGLIRVFWLGPSRRRRADTAIFPPPRGKGLENHRRLPRGSCPRGRGDSLSEPMRHTGTLAGVKPRNGLLELFNAKPDGAMGSHPVLRMIPKSLSST